MVMVALGQGPVAFSGFCWSLSFETNCTMTDPGLRTRETPPEGGLRLQFNPGCLLLGSAGGSKEGNKMFYLRISLVYFKRGFYTTTGVPV
jgi:hypothetical protein